MTVQTLPAHTSEHNTPVAYKGVPVMTTDMLAEAFGTDSTNIRTNHSSNASRFSDGTHFFKVTGAELKALKNQVSFADLVDQRAAHLILWTEKGAARHAKILDTDEAWGVYEKLEETYFAVKAGKLIEAPKAAARVAPVFRDFMAIGKMIGLKGNQQIVAANRATVKLTGVNALETMGETKLLEAEAKTHHTVSELAERAGMKSAQAVNKALERMGFQTCHADESPRWQPTIKGLPHAVLVTVDPEHGKGKARQQWEWKLSVLDAIKAEMGE